MIVGKLSFRIWIVLLFTSIFCSFSVVNISAQVVELEARSCGVSDIAAHNTRILSGALNSGNNVILPEGEFRLNSFSIEDVAGGSLAGSVADGTDNPVSLLFFSGDKGIILSDVSNFKISRLEIGAQSDNPMVEIIESGDFTIENVKIYMQSSSSNICLSYNLDWLIPVLHILL